MQINLLNQNNIEGKGLSVLLGNEGHQVNLIPQKRNEINRLATEQPPSIFLINIDFLIEAFPEDLFATMDSHSTVLLLGNLSQLHWLDKFCAKAKGFVCKNSTFTDLLSSIQKIEKKEMILDQQVQKFLQKTALQKQTSLLKRDLTKALSKTELSLMKEIAKGKATKQIAKEQYLSIHTVYNHRKNIKQKFQHSDSLKLSKFCMLYKEALKTLLLVDNNPLLSGS